MKSYVITIKNPEPERWPDIYIQINSADNKTDIHACIICADGTAQHLKSIRYSQILIILKHVCGTQSEISIEASILEEDIVEHDLDDEIIAKLINLALIDEI